MSEIVQLVSTNGLALVGVCVVYMDMRKQQQKEREDSLNREQNLINQLNSSTLVMQEMSTTLKGIDIRLSEIEEVQK